MVQEETPDRIEPCLLETYPAALADLISDVVTASASLGHRLHPRTATSLAELVRVMSCYYSNLIEGHNTRPRDIERALGGELDANDTRRDLQLEARAHIRVQREIDARFSAGTLGEPASIDLIRSISRGLARGLDDAGEHKHMMDAADAPRRGDLDGRGNLSQEALIEFVTWFCRVALDQLRFMQSLFDLGTLGDRLQAYVRGTLGGGDAASALASEALRAGEVPRGAASRITGRSERSARETLSHLTEARLLVSDTQGTGEAQFLCGIGRCAFSEAVPRAAVIGGVTRGRIPFIRARTTACASSDVLLLDVIDQSTYGPDPVTIEATVKCDEIRQAFDRERRDLDIPGFMRRADAACVYHQPRTGSGGFVSYSESSPEETEPLISTVIDAFVRSRCSEFEWKVFEHDRPADLRARLERRGFRSSAREELMVLPVELVSGLRGSQSARIEHVADAGGLRDYFAVAATHWSGDDGMDALRNELRENPEDLALYVAYDGEQPVASAYARFSKPSPFAGLWAALTLPTHRRRGIYSALVAARALEAARRGFDFVMVDARAESSLILKRMGFLCVTASHACVWTQGAAR